jgi:hypothetical protein
VLSSPTSPGRRLPIAPTVVSLRSTTGPLLVWLEGDAVIGSGEVCRLVDGEGPDEQAGSEEGEHDQRAPSRPAVSRLGGTGGVEVRGPLALTLGPRASKATCCPHSPWTLSHQMGETMPPLRRHLKARR